MSSADDLDEREPPSPSDNGKTCLCVCFLFLWVCFMQTPLLRQMHANVYTNFGLVSEVTQPMRVDLLYVTGKSSK